VSLVCHHVVEFGVVEQETLLRRNAGDILVAMVPADIASGIDVTGIDLLGGTVVEAADVEDQQRVALL
jgi:hypothetical protein